MEKEVVVEAVKEVEGISKLFLAVFGWANI